MFRFLGLFLFMSLFISACSTVPMTGRKQVSLVSNSELTALSDQEYKEIISTSQIEKGTKNAQMVTEVGQKIAKAVEEFFTETNQADKISEFAWEFNLIKDDKTVNAFCMPGGKIVVYTGILPVTKNKEGLAVVMGHEVAHAIANHGAERMSQQMLAGAQVGLLLPYSRLHESEADHIGLILMAKAGYDPKYAVTFWTDMSKLSAGNKPMALLSTHPSDDKRIEDIKKLLPDALKYYKK
jgi:predicted Zn-dependent protease